MSDGMIPYGGGGGWGGGDPRFCGDAFDMLVGQAVPNTNFGGTIVPGVPGFDPRIPGGGYPGGGNCGPWYPPGCAPCPPSSNLAAARQAAYENYCARMAAQERRGLHAEMVSRAPQVILPFNSRQNGNPSVVAPGVLAGATIVLTVSPSVPLCLTKLSFSRVSSPFFVVTSLQSGMETYIADGSNFPTDSFAPDAEDIPKISLPTVYPGTEVTLTLLNITAEPHEVWGNFWGLRLSKPGPCL